MSRHTPVVGKDRLYVDVTFRAVDDGASRVRVWGPFSSHDRAENAVARLAGRDDVLQAQVREEAAP